MRSITKEALWQAQKDAGNMGAFVDETIQNSVGFYELIIEDEETLRSLLYPSHPQSRILAPLKSSKDHYYTLGEVVDRMIENDWTFEALANGEIEGEYNTNFFTPMMPLFNDFDIKRAQYVLLRPIGERSRYYCPKGLFYIEDGAHRTLVTAYLLRKKQIKFEPLTYHLIQPRQRKNWLERLVL
jgi:hypothetical protein